MLPLELGIRGNNAKMQMGGGFLMLMYRFIERIIDGNG
jgi:hypothetical protein